MTEYIENTWLETEVCCKCGMMFAMPKDYQRRRRDDHAVFYCPSGHSQHYTGKTEAQRLKDQLADKDRSLAWERDRANRIKHERDQVTRAHQRMRIRVANGVCPCCNRSFENLRNHMKSQHPEFGDQQTLYALRTAFGMTQQQVADEAGVSAPTVSNYERGKLVSADMKQRLDAWTERQGAAA